MTAALGPRAGARPGARPDARIDEERMRRCLELARRAEGRTAPNPMVGCVIVDPAGRVVGEGYHRRAGAPHAEIEALRAAGGRAPGCTMYVNLEPCRHVKRRRTGPCAPAVLESGIARLVVGIGDPIPSHRGGAAWLARQGIAVTRGVLRGECAELNRAFLTWARERRPWFVLKSAITLDGRISTRSGESQWITEPRARRHAHHQRDRLDAVLVGVGTALADDPQLTVRVRGGRDPMRVVLDARLRTPVSARLLPRNNRSTARVVIATNASAPRARERELEAAGAEIWRFPGRGRLVDLAEVAARLAKAEVMSVLVEGGAEVHASFLAADLADELLLYVAPMVIGGAGAKAAPAWAGGAGAATLAEAERFRFSAAPERLGDDLLLVARRR